MDLQRNKLNLYSYFVYTQSCSCCLFKIDRLTMVCDKKDKNFYQKMAGIRKEKKINFHLAIVLMLKSLFRSWFLTFQLNSSHFLLAFMGRNHELNFFKDKNPIFFVSSVLVWGISNCATQGI